MPTFASQKQPSIADKLAELIAPSREIAPPSMHARPDFFSAASHLVKAVNMKQQALAHLKPLPGLNHAESKVLRSVHLQERGK